MLQLLGKVLVNCKGRKGEMMLRALEDESFLVVQTISQRDSP